MVSGIEQNFVPSAIQFGKDLVNPILHPIDTYTALTNLGKGVGQKFVPGEQPEERYADAVAQFFIDRYGGLENAKRTLTQDPVGFAADLSMVLTGGGSAAARVPGLVGKAGRATKSLGSAIDPVAGTLKGVGYGASELIGNLGTHTGGSSLRLAAGAGAAGGTRASDFLENLRGTAPAQSAVDDARAALGKIRERRGIEYRIGKLKWATDQTVLDFRPLDQALLDIEKIKTFKGQNISESTATIRQKLTDTVEQWRQLNPREFHTAEGFDALKQKVGDIRDALPYGTPERKVADEVYSSVWKQIQKQSPTYAKAMKDYEEASTLIREMEGTLSLNRNARVDTQLRKLQSILRNNANTNYGRRVELGQILQQAGATHLMEKLAGQALSAWAPRGLGRVVAGGTAAAGYLDPSMLALLPLQSPRVMGEAAYHAGKFGQPVGHGLFQAGRLEPELSGY
jgi:hypothetical protein